MMEKKLFVLLISLIWGHMLFAQDVIITEKPTANWPFYFEDFVGARIDLRAEKESYTETSININLFSGELQYLDQSKTIRILDNIEDVVSIIVGDSLRFTFVDGNVHRIVSDTKKYMITCRKRAKLSDLEEGGGAYGSNVNTAAVDQINSKLIGGLNNFNYPMLVDTKNEGKNIDPEIKYYFINGSESFIINRRNLTRAFKSDAKKISSYIKQEKIFLKNENDLAQLLDFVSKL